MTAPGRRRRAAAAARRLRDLPPPGARGAMAEWERREIERQAAANMRGFDELPAPVRAALAGSVTGVHPADAHRAISAAVRAGMPRAEAEGALPLLIAARDEDDVRAMAERCLRASGRPSAHVAAGATILRPRNDEVPNRARRRRR